MKDPLLGAAQRRCLDMAAARLGTATVPMPDTRLADVVGCHKSDVCRFRQGERAMDLKEVQALVNATEDARVADPIMEWLGATGPTSSAVNLPREVCDLHSNTASLHRTIAAAQENGRIEPDEAKRIHDDVDRIQRNLDRINGVRVGRCG